MQSSVPPGCTVVAGRGGLQPHHRKCFTEVPPCWVTGPKGLMRAGCLQQVRWGGKSGTARKELDKDNEGEKRRGLKQKGREKTGTRQQRGGKTARTETGGARNNGDGGTTRGPAWRPGGKRPAGAWAPCRPDDLSRNNALREPSDRYGHQARGAGRRAHQAPEGRRPADAWARCQPRGHGDNAPLGRGRPALAGSFAVVARQAGLPGG